MHLEQKSWYGCGVHSVANALQSESFVNRKRIELSKNGNNIGQLNRWLLKHYIKCWISTIIYNNGDLINLLDLEPKFIADNDNQWYPFLITVKSTNRINHMIGCRYMKSMEIISHDSLCEEPIIFKNFNDFNDYYKEKIISLDVFVNYNNDPIFMQIKNESI